MARSRSFDYNDLIKEVRKKTKLIKAAKMFGISRSRAGQILREHAPELLTPEAFAARAETPERIAMRKATVSALKRHRWDRARASADLKISPAGLHGRIRRLGIQEPAKVNSQNP